MAYLLTENIISKTHVGLPRKNRVGRGKRGDAATDGEREAVSDA